MDAMWDKADIFHQNRTHKSSWSKFRPIDEGKSYSLTTYHDLQLPHLPGPISEAQAATKPPRFVFWLYPDLSGEQEKEGPGHAPTLSHYFLWVALSGFMCQRKDKTSQCHVCMVSVRYLIFMIKLGSER